MVESQPSPSHSDLHLKIRGQVWNRRAMPITMTYRAEQLAASVSVREPPTAASERECYSLLQCKVRKTPPPRVWTTYSTKYRVYQFRASPG